MQILFLGTGAADWDIKKRSHYGEFRRFSSAIIDNSLLIDPGPHIFDFAEKTNNPCLFNNVKNIIVTHSHHDHFDSQTVSKLCSEHSPRLWGDAGAMRKLTKELSPTDLGKIAFTATIVNKKIDIDNSCSILPLRANHSTSDADETCLNYIIECNGKTIFYGLDSGWILFDSWQIMKDYKFDAFIMEATIGDVEGDYRVFGHNNLQMIEIMLSSIKGQKILNNDAKVIVSHMAKTLHTSHKKLQKRLEKSGIVPAFDGMVTEI